MTKDSKKKKQYSPEEDATFIREATNLLVSQGLVNSTEFLEKLDEIITYHSQKVTESFFVNYCDFKEPLTFEGKTSGETLEELLELIRCFRSNCTTDKHDFKLICPNKDVLKLVKDNIKFLNNLTNTYIFSEKTCKVKDNVLMTFTIRTKKSCNILKRNSKI